MKHSNEINTYLNAIVDNSNPNKRIVVLTDKKDKYIQIFFTNNSDLELIEQTRLMRDIGIKSFK